MSRKVPFADRSPHGWWIASYIEWAVFDDEKLSAKDRILAYENAIILKAANREAAYKKAIRLASQNDAKFKDDRTNRQGHWEFVGLTSLLPIYEELKDGAEIWWRRHRRSVGKTRSMVKGKSKLEVFASQRDRSSNPQ
jgi:hypothetical protein